MSVHVHQHQDSRLKMVLGAYHEATGCICIFLTALSADRPGVEYLLFFLLFWAFFLLFKMVVARPGGVGWG